MASIVQRGKSHSVVYSVEGKQKWETFPNAKEAQKRKIEIAYQQSTGTFVPPSPTTIEGFLDEYVNTYGTTNWSFSTFNCNTSLIKNYVLPHIGTWKLKDVNTRRMDGYFADLKTKYAVQLKGRKKTGLISDRTIHDIYVVLNSAFSLAVEWEYLGKNPISKTMRPHIVRKEREVWEPEVAKKAISLCQNERLLPCLHLGLACTMRLGEILGLRWQFVDFGDVENNFSGAKLHVDCVLQRISAEAMEKLSRKNDQIKFVFLALKEHCTTKLVLKLPKTEKSIRDIWIPSTVAAYLWQLKQSQEELKELLGDEYTDYDLVVAQSTGRPVELRLVEEALEELIQEYNLPVVQFHSLRHTSTSYKLVLSNGDIKAVQGETGHAQAMMVTEVYSHIFDEGRKEMAKLFEQSFYGGKEQFKQNGDTDLITKSTLEQFLFSEQGMESLIQTLIKHEGGKELLASVMEKIAV